MYRDRGTHFRIEIRISGAKNSNVYLGTEGHTSQWVYSFQELTNNQYFYRDRGTHFRMDIPFSGVTTSVYRDMKTHYRMGIRISGAKNRRVII